MKIRSFFSILLFSLFSFIGVSQPASVIPIVDDEINLIIPAVDLVVISQLAPIDVDVTIHDDVHTVPTSKVLDMSPRSEVIVRESEPPHDYNKNKQVSQNNILRNPTELKTDHPDL